MRLQSEVHLSSTTEHMSQFFLWQVQHHRRMIQQDTPSIFKQPLNCTTFCFVWRGMQPNINTGEGASFRLLIYIRGTSYIAASVFFILWVILQRFQYLGHIASGVFLDYFMIICVSKTTWLRMVGFMTKGELKRILREVVVV